MLLSAYSASLATAAYPCSHFFLTTCPWKAMYTLYSFPFKLVLRHIASIQQRIYLMHSFLLLSFLGCISDRKLCLPRSMPHAERRENENIVTNKYLYLNSTTITLCLFLFHPVTSHAYIMYSPWTCLAMLPYYYLQSQTRLKCAKNTASALLFVRVYKPAING